MVMFKACPRCQGDMHENRDMYGEYRECLMCGYMADIRKPGLFGMEMAPAPKKVSKRPATERGHRRFGRHSRNRPRRSSG